MLTRVKSREMRQECVRQRVASGRCRYSATMGLNFWVRSQLKPLRPDLLPSSPRWDLCGCFCSLGGYQGKARSDMLRFTATCCIMTLHHTSSQPTDASLFRLVLDTRGPKATE